ncbi:MAG: hypothetical protein V8Q30_01440 [Acutalibacteraceae bacterium]
MTLTILGPVQDYDDLNLTSVVCRVDAGERSFLFTGDMEKKAENDLWPPGRISPQMCSRWDTMAHPPPVQRPFWRKWSPVCSVIPVGEGNSYGHPTAATLERLNEYGPVYRTDLLGEYPHLHRWGFPVGGERPGRFGTAAVKGGGRHADG